MTDSKLQVEISLESYSHMYIRYNPLSRGNSSYGGKGVTISRLA